MELDGQAILLEMPEQPEPASGPAPVNAPAKLREVDRSQSMLAHIQVDELIGADHKARAIWELTGQLEMSGFTEPLKTRRGSVGRAAWDPRLLVSMWVYAYSEGISSAREIERIQQAVSLMS